MRPWRAQGRDPEASSRSAGADLADRVQAAGVPSRTQDGGAIRDLEAEHDGNRERMALEIAKIVSAETFLYATKRTCASCNGRVNPADTCATIAGVWVPRWSTTPRD